MKISRPICAALIVAAGQGNRAGGDIPKQFRRIAGKPILAHAVEAFVSHSSIDKIVLVIGKGQEDKTHQALGDIKLDAIVHGAECRRGSVRAGLDALSAMGGCDHVFIHDAARPFLPPSVLDRLSEALNESVGAIPVLPMADSLVRGMDGIAGETVDRSQIYRVQTPQAFRFDEVIEAHDQWNATIEATDDAQMVRNTGHHIVLVEGDERLEKLTFPDDFVRAEMRFEKMVRVGMGYDVHRLVDGEDLWLGGVKIDHDKGLSGHSDADVALHAIVDAILGALGDGDIGSHFPPSDPKWRGASSDRFLVHARDLALDRGAVINHIDLTIICEAPKIGPHRESMRIRVAEILEVPVDRISIKATTTEKLGFTGRGEGIAAQAVATLSLPAHN